VSRVVPEKDKISQKKSKYLLKKYVVTKHLPFGRMPQHVKK